MGDAGNHFSHLEDVDDAVIHVEHYTILKDGSTNITAFRSEEALMKSLTHEWKQVM